MSSEAKLDLSEIDAEHHLHPFTNNKRLAEEGSPIVMDRGKGYYF